MKKISIIFMFLLVFAFSISNNNIYGWTSFVNANPDYICKKSVNNEPCVINECWSWDSTWTRTCYWTKTTEVSYYLIRTDCEAWYTKVAKWWNVWWASWRQWSDYVSGTNSCSVVQVDRVSPFWELKLN